MTITHDQEENKNPIEEAVKKQNESLLTFFTQTTSESYIGDSDIYDEEVYAFDMYPEISEEQKINLENFKQELKHTSDNSMDNIVGILRDKKEGAKYNEGKLPLEKILFTQFPKAIQALAKCSLNGHDKYKEFDKDWLNFKRVEGGSQTYADAALRHSIDKGELNDSGLPHIFHKLWNVMAEVELYIEENNLKI